MQQPYSVRPRFPRRLLAAGMVLSVLLSLGLAWRGVRTASADSTAAVSCSLDSVGLQECTVTLAPTIGAGGSFTATQLNPAAVFVGCADLSTAAPCSVTATMLTFFCPSGCPSGSTYLELVQVSAGPADQQVFSAQGVVAASVLPSAPITNCFDANNNPVACSTLQGNPNAVMSCVQDSSGNPTICSVQLVAAPSAGTTAPQVSSAQAVVAPNPPITNCFDASNNPIPCSVLQSNPNVITSMSCVVDSSGNPTVCSIQIAP